MFIIRADSLPRQFVLLFFAPLLCATVLSGCQWASPSPQMARSLDYVQTHRGTGTKQTFPMSLPATRTGFSYALKAIGPLRIMEDAILAESTDANLAIGAFFRPIQPDQTEVEILAASPYLRAEQLRDIEKNFLQGASQAVELEQLKAQSQAASAEPAPHLETSDKTIVSGAMTFRGSEVDLVPIQQIGTRKHAYAIVIGIEQYREKLPKADFADRDAKLVGEYLTKTMGYPEENVVVRTNEKASMNDLVKYLESWLPNNVEKDSPVFIYYSGHGAPNTKTGDAYLVPYDGDPTFVDKTGYPLKKLYAQLESLPTRDITVVLDSCFSGAGGRSVIGKGLRPMGLSTEYSISASGKTVVLSASSGDQVSSTYEEKGHGLLTYFFLKGLQGEGDLNKDGIINMAELYDYVKPNVSKVARKRYNNEQTPQLLGSSDSLKKGGRLIERSTP